MIGLLLETERCLDGVTPPTTPWLMARRVKPTPSDPWGCRAPLADGFFRPRSERREPVHLVTADLEDPIVLQFVNARDDLAPFMSRYSAGSVFTPIASETEGVESEPFAHIKTLTFWQDGLHELLAHAGGPDPVEAFVNLRHLELEASFHLRDGKPQMLVRCKHLLDLMKMEVGVIALEGAKLATCEHCPNLFLTGSSTSRRSHATFCSDRCRVAAMRARKKESQ